jgi:predicted deacylase
LTVAAGQCESADVWIIRNPRHRAVLVLVLSTVTAAAVAPSFRSMRKPDIIRAGPGVGHTGRLSDFHPPLAGGPGDTPVFVLEGVRPGGTVLVLGGTHADEPAGYLAAVVLVETARVEAGRLIVIPRANASGFTHNMPQEAHPQSIFISTPDGIRSFTYGARATNPIHQWPDPQVYTLAASGQSLSGIETRNLNRAYPGSPDGTLTEQIAFGITELIRKKSVDLAIDLHEASPEYPVVNTIVAHERAMDLAALANMNLQEQGMQIGIETSPANLHGLSHREWGDATGTMSVLMETTNPAQGRLRGRTDEYLVVHGRDRFYVQASEHHRLSVPYPETGWPIEVRVARHLAGVRELVTSLGATQPEKAVTLVNVTDYDALVHRGLGTLLK